MWVQEALAGAMSGKPDPATGPAGVGHSRSNGTRWPRAAISDH